MYNFCIIYYVYVVQKHIFFLILSRIISFLDLMTNDIGIEERKYQNSYSHIEIKLVICHRDQLEKYLTLTCYKTGILIYLPLNDYILIFPMLNPHRHLQDITDYYIVTL
jgi:hypothetical protein